MPRNVRQVGKGSLLSCAKEKDKETYTDKCRDKSTSKPKTVKTRVPSTTSDSDAKLWSSIKRTLDTETIAKIASMVDARNTPSNPIHHPSVQGLRKELRAIASTAPGPFLRIFTLQHDNQVYTIDVTIRENTRTYIVFKGMPGVPRNTIIKPKILATFSHSMFMNQNHAPVYYSDIEVNRLMCSDEQERLFYAVVATMLTSKRLFNHELVSLDRVKVRLIGVGDSGQVITTLRDRVRDLRKGS